MRAAPDSPRCAGRARSPELCPARTAEPARRQLPLAEDLSLLRDAFNYEHGWTRPDDPSRARPFRPAPHLASQARAGHRAGEDVKPDPRREIGMHLLELVAVGTVKDRAGVVAARWASTLPSANGQCARRRWGNSGWPRGENARGEDGRRPARDGSLPPRIGDRRDDGRSGAASGGVRGAKASRGSSNA